MWNGFFVVFAVRGMVMVTYSGSVLSPLPLRLQHVRDLPYVSGS